MKTIRVLLFDDQHLTREGVALLLKQMNNIKVVGSTGNLHDFKLLFRDHKPHIVLLGASVNGKDSAPYIEYMQRTVPESKAVILTSYEDGRFVDRMLQMGVLGYLTKNIDPLELERAIHSVFRGKRYISLYAEKKYLKYRVKQKEVPQLKLTPREIEILQLLGKGLTNAEISEEIKLGIRTIETHREKIRSKIGATSMLEVYRYAWGNYPP